VARGVPRTGGVRRAAKGAPCSPREQDAAEGLLGAGRAVMPRGAQARGGLERAKPWVSGFRQLTFPSKKRARESSHGKMSRSGRPFISFSAPFIS